MKVEDYNIEAEEDLMNVIASFIKDRRNELGMTQQELSYLANVNRAHIASIETGFRSNVTVKYLAKIIKALNLQLILKPIEE